MFMKKFLFWHIVLAVFYTATIMNVYSQGCASAANIYLFTYNAKNYEVVKELKNWTDAAACAVERGGYLAQIGSLDEQNAIYNAIISGAGVSTTYTTVMDGGGIAYVWIGATDKFSEGNWNWDGNNDNSGILFWTGQGAAGANNGSAVIGAYINWGGTSTGIIKEPDDYNSNQDAAAIALNGWPGGSGSLGIAGEWNDIALTNNLYFVIEYDSTGVGYNDQLLTPDFSMYPIPSNGSLNFDFLNYMQFSEINLEVLDIQGRNLYSLSTEAIPKINIDLRNFIPGIYLIRITTDHNFSACKKLILY